ncbi:hypothetical protein Nepgr_005871 [Nepenthes gracilis]|uniref:THO complex subunit 5 n=1 Tax=Nepenthes gracilis TaxID=150966 RepID=A0AAD3XGV0_NEPGR|nr:hypothetical protein Nepgr_005871 [Nepenthes gracilis]
MEVKMEDAGAVEEKADAAPSTKQKVEKSAYDLLKESKTLAEDIVGKMLSIKKENQPKSELRELVTQMFLHFVSLRQANRSVLIEEDRVKAETERSKAPVDFTTLQLHNLMYEKNHYVKAIKACKDFKSKYPDIELVSEEEFFTNAPEDIKGPTARSNDTAHNLMLKRLNYELFQRKELCKLHEQLEQRKKGLLETIANRKKFLSSLPSHLKSLKKASLPLQQQLGVLHTKKLKQQHSAELLPPPLYIIYSQFMAQKEAFGENIDMEIIGSMKDAQAFARQQSDRDTGISTNQESMRMDEDVPDDEDDDQRRRKRPKKISGKENLDQSGMYQAHPLRIILHIYDDEVSDPKLVKLVTLKFEYLLKLNVVCVGIEGSGERPENIILSNLFPDDTGLELPHQSAKLFLGDGVVFDERRPLHPFKWAQHLAGIDFLPELSPLLSSRGTQTNESARTAVISGLSLYRQQNRIQTVCQRLRSRVKAQRALAEQLELLMKLKWPSLTCETVPWALHKPLCSLHSWSPIGSSSNVDVYMPVIDVEQGPGSSDTTTVNGRSGDSKEVVEIATEDGELPSLVLATTVTKDDKLPKEGLDREHSRGLALISKGMVSFVKTVKSQSFRRHDDDPDLTLDSESDLDELAKVELEAGNPSNPRYNAEEKLWMDHGAKEFLFVLTRKMDKNEEDVKLEAKVKISIEYPLRPPLFLVSRLFQSSGEAISEIAGPDWYNELRAMEAEVNLHTLKMLPSDQQNYILSHQVCFLAMLFDFYMNEVSQPYEHRTSTSVVDVGLCKPTSGAILTRSFRGRDRRKMLSWKDMECSPGYPY